MTREPTGWAGSSVVCTLSDRPRRRNGRWLRGRLPLLLEDLLELRAGQRDGHDVVDERQHVVGLGVGDHAVGVGRVLVVSPLKSRSARRPPGLTMPISALGDGRG